MKHKVVECSFDGACAYATDLINDNKSITLQESEIVNTFHKIFKKVQNSKLNAFKVSNELNNILNEKGLFS